MSAQHNRRGGCYVNSRRVSPAFWNRRNGLAAYGSSLRSRGVGLAIRRSRVGKGWQRAGRRAVNVRTGEQVPSRARSVAGLGESTAVGSFSRLVRSRTSPDLIPPLACCTAVSPCHSARACARATFCCWSWRVWSEADETSCEVSPHWLVPPAHRPRTRSTSTSRRKTRGRRLRQRRLRLRLFRPADTALVSFRL